MKRFTNEEPARAEFLGELARQGESDPDFYATTVSFLTTCPVCGDRYEALTQEEAHSPNRLCWNCWKVARAGARSGFAPRRAVVRGIAVSSHDQERQS